MDSLTYTACLAQATDTTSDSDASGWWAVIGLLFFVLLVIVAVGGVVLFIAALVSILSSRRLTFGGKLLWCIAVFVFQLIGPLVWFLWGRKAQLSRPQSPYL